VAVLHVVTTGVSGKEPRTEQDGTATSQTHVWTLKGLADEVPSYAEVLEPILALLQREGLITEVPPQTYDDQAAGVQLVRK
jgi:hypothetical protein